MHTARFLSPAARPGFNRCSLAKTLVSAIALVVLGAAAFALTAAAAGPAEAQEVTVDRVSAESQDLAAFLSTSYVRNHTTALLSRPGLSFVKGVVVVQFAEDVTFGSSSEEGKVLEEGLLTGESQLNALLLKQGLIRAERLFPWDCEGEGGGHCNFFRLSFPEDTDLASLMQELGAAPGVTSVEPVGVHPVDHYPDDFWFPVQWPLNQREDHDVNAPECWDVEKGDSSIVVAVIDTGVDWEHPDLGGAAPYTGGNVWTNWTEFYGTTGADDDGNGFIDDVRGWDFVDNVSGYAGEDADEPDNDPMDFFGHGTHVAGIVAAIADNGIGVAGLANGCKVMPVRAGWATYSGGSPPRPAGVVRMDFCAQAMFYAARNGARIINCSWANDSSGGLNVAADTAAARGATIVVSAGNSNSTSQTYNFLSTRPYCLAVAATDSNDVKNIDSNYGTWVDFCAPGEWVASTHRSLGGAHGYAWMTGTSMAAPYVSALDALLLSQESSLSRNDVRNIISSTCDDIDDLNPGYGGLLGAGRINAYAALSRETGDWQARTGGSVTSSPVPFEDGSFTHVAVSSGDSCVYVFDSEGEPVSGWPVCVSGELTSPAAGDIDDDGDTELVVGTSAGVVYAWDASGSDESGWPVSVGQAVTSGPMLCDLDKDTELEIVCATADSLVHVLRADGSVQPGWPVALSGHVTSQPCLAFLGADTVHVVLVGTSDSRLNALENDGTHLGGWPLALGSDSLGSPVVLDLDRDGRSEILVCAADGTIYGVDDDGAFLSGWPRAVSGRTNGSPALGDVDGDGIPDVVVSASDGAVYALDLSGQPLSGWPVQTDTAVASSPSLVDLDNDGACEIAVGSDDRDFHVWAGVTGQPFAGWPRSTGGAVRSSPCLWDFDRDGSLELAVGSGDRKLHLWQLDGSFAVDSLLAWPMYRHDGQRSGNSGFDVELPPPPPPPGLVVSAYPNPFAGTVTFECSVTGRRAGGSGRRGKIELYDVSGRRLGELAVTGTGDLLSLTWDGTNQAARTLSSGVYFYSAVVDGMEATGKLVFFRQ